MAQSNYNIPNESAPAVRAQLNAVFQSIATNNSGSSAPTTTFAHQWWYDTTTNILKQRNAADSAWIDIGTFDQSGGTFTPAGTPQLTQAQAENPTSTVFGLVSGERLAPISFDAWFNLGNQLSGLGAGNLSLPSEAFTGGFSITSTASIFYVSAGTLGITSRATGTIRFFATRSSGANVAQIRLLKNSAEVFQSPVGGFQEFSVDVSAASGDVFEWQVRRNGGSASDSVIITNISQRADDTVQRLGRLIKASQVI